MFTAATGGDRHVGITFVDIDEPRIDIDVRRLETPGPADTGIGVPRCEVHTFFNSHRTGSVDNINIAG